MILKENQWKSLCAAILLVPAHKIEQKHEKLRRWQNTVQMFFFLKHTSDSKPDTWLKQHFQWLNLEGELPSFPPSIYQLPPPEALNQHRQTGAHIKSDTQSSTGSAETRPGTLQRNYTVCLESYKQIIHFLKNSLQQNYFHRLNQHGKRMF